MGGDDKSSLKQIGIYAAYGMEITYPALGGVVAGHFLDRWLGTAPWFTLALLISGFIAGIGNTFRLIKKLEKKSGEEKQL